jgi:serine/threonine protein kinase
MSITFECQCKRRLHASDEMAGRRIRCPNCRTIQRVPRDEGTVRTCSLEDDESADLLNPALLEDTALLDLERVVTRPQFDLGTETSHGTTFQPGEGPLPFFGLPGYLIERELGRGGAGVVFLARDMKQDRRVAIKVMLSGAGCRPDELARFNTETLVVAALEHPSLVRVFDVGEQDGVPYCIMEYVEGGQLRQRLRGKALSPQEAATLAVQLADAVQTVHQARVIHRDLKPENILLASDGSPRITDFGLARRLDGGPRLTWNGQVFGTPCYMAPEQAAGQIEEVGPLADVYALGAILYEMLTGYPPFEGVTDAQTLALVLSQEPRSPRQLNPDIPLDLETVCLRCLQKDPKHRYPGAAALAEDLRRVLDGRPILTRPISPRPQPWWWPRNKRVRIALIAALAVLLTVSAIGGGVAAFILVQQNAELTRHKGLSLQISEARAQARAGQVDSALVSAERLAREPRLPGHILYDLASVYALALPRVANAQQTSYVKQAVELLERARRERYFDQAVAREALDQDKDFQDLKERAEFKAFRDSLGDRPATR